MFTIGFRGCDFHEKDACGSAGSASLTGSGPSAGSSHAVPFLNATFWTLWKATKPIKIEAFCSSVSACAFPFYCSSAFLARFVSRLNPSPSRRNTRLQRSGKLALAA